MVQPKRIYRTIEENIEIFKYAEQYSIHKASEKYDIDRQNIRTWKKSAAKLNCYDKKISKTTMHSGKKKQETEDIDDEVVEWILMNRKIGIAVTS